MPSTRRQKTEARRSREMDMMRDFENMDLLRGREKVNPIEKELVNAIIGSISKNDAEALPSKERIHHKRINLGTLTAKTPSLVKKAFLN